MLSYSAVWEGADDTALRWGSFFKELPCVEDEKQPNLQKDVSSSSSCDSSSYRGGKQKVEEGLLMRYAYDVFAVTSQNGMVVTDPLCDYEYEIQQEIKLSNSKSVFAGSELDVDAEDRDICSFEWWGVRKGEPFLLEEMKKMNIKLMEEAKAKKERLQMEEEERRRLHLQREQQEAEEAYRRTRQKDSFSSSSSRDSYRGHNRYDVDRDFDRSRGDRGRDSRDDSRDRNRERERENGRDYKFHDRVRGGEGGRGMEIFPQVDAKFGNNYGKTGRNIDGGGQHLSNSRPPRSRSREREREDRGVGSGGWGGNRERGRR